MTDKQIIIDGVDVSKCCNVEPTATTPKCAINDWIHCDGQNCYFKQLKRKEQKLEKIEDRVQDLDNYSEKNVEIMEDILTIIQGE